MNAKTESPSFMFDTVKWIFIAMLLVAGIVANSYLADYSMVIKLAGWLLLVAVVVTIAFQTTRGRRSWAFIQEAQIEVRKVVWPTRQETIQTTVVVIAMVVITALFLWGIDSILLWLVGLLTGHRG